MENEKKNQLHGMNKWKKITTILCTSYIKIYEYLENYLGLK
jgi:hypothetical protein